MTIQRRKAEHIEICLLKNVRAHRNHWDHVHFGHEALPEVDLSDISLETDLFGKKLEAPIVVAAITGGTDEAKEINENIARAAADLGIGMGVGSQRPAIENPELEYTYDIVKQYDVPLVIGNVGAPQLIDQERPALGTDAIERAIGMIDADVLAVHLNFLQEVVQPEGDHRSTGCFDAIRNLSSTHPIIVKETGAGLSKETLDRLKDTEILGIDVGGMGGTSFAAVELYRVGDGNERLRRLGNTFWDWGIPTPVTLTWAKDRFETIATGGVRNGLDCAKAVALGAGAAGMAGILLRSAVEGYDNLLGELETVIAEIRAAMFLTGARDLEGLREKKILIEEPIRSWLTE